MDGCCTEAQADQRHTEDEDRWAIIPALGESPAEWGCVNPASQMEGVKPEEAESWPGAHSHSRAGVAAQANLTLRLLLFLTHLTLLSREQQSSEMSQLCKVKQFPFVLTCSVIIVVNLGFQE